MYMYEILSSYSLLQYSQEAERNGKWIILLQQTDSHLCNTENTEHYFFDEEDLIWRSVIHGSLIFNSISVPRDRDTSASDAQM